MREPQRLLVASSVLHYMYFIVPVFILVVISTLISKLSHSVGRTNHSALFHEYRAFASVFVLKFICHLHSASGFSLYIMLCRIKLTYEYKPCFWSCMSAHKPSLKRSRGLYKDELYSWLLDVDSLCGCATLVCMIGGAA